MVAAFRSVYDDFVYVPSDDDIIWAGVALYGETRGNHSQAEWGRILWTWMNRFMLHIPRPRVWPTLQNLIMNHSQPVNPKWRLGGSRCPVVGASHSNCSESRLVWRDNMAGSIAAGWAGFDDLPQDLSDFVALFFMGGVPQPAGEGGNPLIDFGVTKAATDFGNQYETGGNYFLTAVQSASAGLLSNFAFGEIVVDDPTGGFSAPEYPADPGYLQDDFPVLTYLAVGAWTAAALGAIWYLLKQRG